MKTKINTTGVILWAVYISLLTVLLPHTAWAFDRFEPEGGIRLMGTSLTAWLAALAFEAAIAVLTHRLASHMETTPRYTSGNVKLRILQYRYMNAYAMGLLVTVFVSAFANLAHAVEFGNGLQIAPKGSFIYAVYLAAFGAVLPFASLLFARVLSRAVDEFHTDSPEVQAMKERLRQAGKELQDLKRELGDVKLAGKNEQAKLASEIARLTDELQRMKELPLVPERVGTYGRDLLAIIAGNETAATIAERHNVSEATVSRDKAKLNGANG